MILNDSYTHGGDVYRHRVELDFSANVNPLGTPPEVAAAVAAAARDMSAYPDPCCGALREKLARACGAAAGDILCGNGAAELIFQFVSALRPRRALLPVPSFSEYEAALDAVGCGIEFFPLRREEGFALSGSVLECITPETDVLMLCSPNNPTGVCVPPALLEAVLARCRETGTWLFLDECFLELTDDGAAESLIPLLRPGDRVLLLRAFTKLYGLAGARLGWAVCRCRALTDAMCRLVQPWNVSSLAQAAGEAALECGDFVARTRALVAEEKAFLQARLSALGVAFLPGRANFLMLSGVPGLCEALLERGILIRSCANYRGLGPGDCRIAVRTRPENLRLLEAMEDVLRHA